MKREVPSIPDMDTEDEVQHKAAQAAMAVLRNWKLLIVLLIAVAAAIMFLLLNSSRSQQKALQQQIEQQQQQLERQNQLIEALKNKEPADKSNETVPIVTSDIIKQQLNSVRELVTQQYIYTNADKKESSETWLWGVERPFSGKSILITYDGIIKAGVDLSQTEIEVNEEAHTIQVTLPPSKITDNNIPQESIKVVEVKNGFFNDVTFDNFNDFVSEQKLVMEQKAIDQGILDKADEEAQTLVTSILSVLPGMDAYTLKIEQSK